jgi:hypothetical protein
LDDPRTVDQNPSSSSAYWPAELVSPFAYKHDYDGLIRKDKTETVSYYVRGTDMGATVELNGKMFFYMGDTWGFRADCDGDGVSSCSEKAVRNDAIVISTDTEFSNGVDVSLILGARQRGRLAFGFQGIGVQGLHYDTWDSSVWDDPSDPEGVGKEPEFTVPNAAVLVPDAPHSSALRNFKTPRIVVFYSTASTGGAAVGGGPMVEFSDESADAGWDNCITNDSDCSTPYSRKNPRLWMACSADGLEFHNCYPTVNGKQVAFSADEFRWDTCSANARQWSWQRRARFASVTPLYLGQVEFDKICLGQNPSDPDNPMCEHYRTDGTSGGILLYGLSRPARMSPLSLAFIDVQELGHVHANGPFAGRPIAHYFIGDNTSDGVTSWSDDEQDAIPIPERAWLAGYPCDEANDLGGGYAAAIEEAFDAVQAALSADPNSEIAARAALWRSSADADFKAFIDDIIRAPLIPAIVNFATVFKRTARYRYCATQQAYEFPPETCLLNLSQAAWTFRPYSARVVTGDEPRILLFGNRYSWAPLARPWELSAPVSLGDLAGTYGVFILPSDKAVEYEELDAQHHTGKLRVWHLLSTWDGPRNKQPYGVYTKKSSIDWPPAYREGPIIEPLTVPFQLD